MNRPSAPLEVREPAPPASPAETRRPSSSRIGELDALRGLAALAVVFHHLTRRFYEEYGRPPDSIPPFPISGNHGVFLFFIISGFVITQTLERTKRARDFVVSRFSRIYPSFWTAVLLTWGLVAVFGLPGREVTPVEALINLTMLQDHFFVRQVDYVYWSLTMEVTFYVLAFIAHVRGWLWKSPHACAWVWLGYSAVLVVLKRFAGFEVPWNVVLLTLPIFAPLFVAGIMFHRLYTGRGTTQTYAVLACCLVLHNAWNWGGKTGTVLSVAMFACFFLVVAGRFGILRARPLLFLGAISYPLYLLHNNVGMIAIRELMSLGLSYNLALVAALAFVIALSTAVTWGVEKPAMRWIRSRFERRPQTEASGP